MWNGECFVFDERVSVGHGLQPGPYELCRSCRWPLGAEDKASPHYVKGVSCPHCHGKHDESQLRNFAERQKQIALAQKRGQRHVGEALPPPEVRRAEKRAKIAANQARLEAAALPIYERGHLPLLGEWLALPIIHAAGGREPGDAVFHAYQYPVAERLLAR